MYIFYGASDEDELSQSIPLRYTIMIRICSHETGTKLGNGQRQNIWMHLSSPAHISIINIRDFICALVMSYVGYFMTLRESSKITVLCLPLSLLETHMAALKSSDSSKNGRRTYDIIF